MARLIPATLPAAVDDAVAVLDRGGVVVLPTDTVYGIAARPDLPAAVERIFELKERPAGMHLAVLIAGTHQLPLVTADSRPGVGRLADDHWPGALTVVVGQAARLVSGLGDGDGTVGVRCPDHDLVRALADRVGPIACTSANRHGHPTPETAALVARELPGADLVIDDGVCAGGVASTVVSVTGADLEILRPGPVTAADLAASWAGGA